MSRRFLRTVALVGVLCSAGVSFNGCSSSSPQYEDGKLFFVNNTRPSGGVEEHVYAVFEEMETPIPFNMTVDGELTGVGAISLTEESLAGGTVVTVSCKFIQQGSGTFYKETTFTIDGNMTVEVYVVDWSRPEPIIALRVHRGKYNGGDPAV